MIIGYLALGILGALLTSAWAAVSGFGLLAILGFYMLGGSLSMAAAICAALYLRPLHEPSLHMAKV